MTVYTECIVAQATPPGYGGVSVVRASSRELSQLVQSLFNRDLIPKKAYYLPIHSSDGDLIDKGMVLYFKGPNSFTGEDVIEFQGHGGPVVVDQVIQRFIDAGARPAKPGEFTQRAFLNDKIDLTQAEAIADLIHSRTEHAARAAMRSLEGDFSRLINEILERLINLRMFIEASMDFPDEDLEFIAAERIEEKLILLNQQIDEIITNSKQGVLLQEGLSVAIVGKPNVGKSTLLNQLSGRDSAIVTDIPGTTRDLVRESVQLDGIPLELVDTAGLRKTDDLVERVGVERAKEAIKKADHLVIVFDNDEDVEIPEEVDLFDKRNITLIINKIDIHQQESRETTFLNYHAIYLSAKTGEGISTLKSRLKSLNHSGGSVETLFTARRRHLVSLEETKKHINVVYQQLKGGSSIELVAEELRLAQNSMSEITGQFTSDDLLGRIFSEFCIGK